MKYCRASLSAASTDSEPPHVNQALVRPAGASGNEIFREPLHRLVREEAHVREGEVVDLRLDRVAHARIAVAETRHRRAARAVEIALALRVDEIHPVAFHGDGKVGVEAVAVKRFSHVARDQAVCGCIILTPFYLREVEDVIEASTAVFA